MTGFEVLFRLYIWAPFFFFEVQVPLDHYAKCSVKHSVLGVSSIDQKVLNQKSDWTMANTAELFLLVAKN